MSKSEVGQKKKIQGKKTEKAAHTDGA